MNKGCKLWLIITLSILTAFLATCITCSYMFVNSYNQVSKDREKLEQEAYLQDLNYKGPSIPITNISITSAGKCNGSYGIGTYAKFVVRNNSNKTITGYVIGWRMKNGLGEYIKKIYPDSTIFYGEAVDQNLKPGHSETVMFSVYEADFSEIVDCWIEKVGSGS